MIHIDSLASIGLVEVILKIVNIWYSSKKLSISVMSFNHHEALFKQQSSRHPHNQFRGMGKVYCKNEVKKAEDSGTY